MVRPVIHKTLAMKAINRHYEHALNWGSDSSFSARILRSMNITLDVSDTEIRSIPQEGPLVIVSNHPFGGLEAMVLGTIFEHIRTDMKFVANFILQSIPEMSERIFAVDPFGGKNASRRNFSGVRQAIRWVEDGHALTVFPAGEVSHLHLKYRRVMDGPWNDMAARIILTTGATVIPVFFCGVNSHLFHLLGLLHPRFRTLMLTRELLKKENSTLAVRIGSPIFGEKSRSFETTEKLTDYLRLRTYILQNRDFKGRRLIFSKFRRKKTFYQNPVADPIPNDRLAAEIALLPPEQCLIDKPPQAVYYFETRQSPLLLQEIGRLRETTFRAVGEGTGKSQDIDEFDQYYSHLIVWDRNDQEIVGAYRVGKTDEILQQYGKKGLYTSTLFHFKKDLLQQIYPALELGRSFVQPRYQRQFSALMLLWKGIGQYVLVHKKYRYLMGPVSISREYSDFSRRFLKQFLQENYSAPELARKVKPVKPLKLKPVRVWTSTASSLVVQNIDDVDELIREMEKEMQGIPVLLRQYLKLDAKLLGFNIDPDFGYVLDALLLVDLKHVPTRILRRYMGTEGVRLFGSPTAHAPDEPDSA
ncbi:lysophospholipid acyltransferase family protein [bacterium]|nr:lysophospholipid acyltransferase family protein [candidate division CSSED10-310 bacterium]